jgi:hypothetical protein
MKTSKIKTTNLRCEAQIKSMNFARREINEPDMKSTCRRMRSFVRDLRISDCNCMMNELGVWIWKELGI